MSQHCRVDGRQRAYAAADALRERGVVVAVDVIQPTDDPTESWTLDILLERRANGVPAPVLSELAARDLTLLDVGLQGGYWQALATA